MGVDWEMQKTLIINAGSSSLKWQLFAMPAETVVASGLVERISMPGSIFTIKYGDHQKFETTVDNFCLLYTSPSPRD